MGCNLRVWGLVLLLSIVGMSAVAEEAQVEVPANDDDFVMLINEVVKKATVLRVKRNNAGYSDLEESNDEKEVDEEMASSGLNSKACISSAAHCTTKAGECKGPVSVCDQAVQSCVNAARDCKVSTQHKETKAREGQPEKIDKKNKVSDADKATDKQLQEGDNTKQDAVSATEETEQAPEMSKRSPSSVQDGQPEVLDEDFDKDELQKDELNSKQSSQEAVAHEAAAIGQDSALDSSPEMNLAEQALTLLEEDEDEDDETVTPVDVDNTHWDTEDTAENEEVVVDDTESNEDDATEADEQTDDADIGEEDDEDAPEMSEDASDEETSEDSADVGEQDVDDEQNDEQASDEETSDASDKLDKSASLKEFLGGEQANLLNLPSLIEEDENENENENKEEQEQDDHADLGEDQDDLDTASEAEEDNTDVGEDQADLDTASESEGDWLYYTPREVPAKEEDNGVYLEFDPSFNADE